MPARDLDIPLRPKNVVLRFPPNWTAVVILAILGSIHLFIAIPAFLAGRFEGEMSLLLGTLFLSVSAGFRLLRCEIVVDASKRVLRQTVWLGRVWHEHVVRFRDVREVRLFLAGGQKGSESLIEVVCADEAMELPPTGVPRQQALYLAMTINVPLVKICMDDVHTAPMRTVTRLDELPSGQEITPDDPS